MLKLRTILHHTVFLLLFTFFSGVSALAQAPDDKSAVYKAGLNYIEGIYEGDSSKLRTSLKTDLKKFGFWQDEKTGEFSEAQWMTYEEALAYADGVKEKKNFAKPDAPKKVEVMDMEGKIAAVKISAWWGVDYMLLSKQGDKWMIEEIIWEGPSLDSKATDEDRKAVKRATLNYIEGFYEGDASKLRASLKPTMYKFGYGYNKKENTYYDGRQMTFDAAINYANGVKEKKEFPGPDAPRGVEVLEVKNKIAISKVRAWWGIDYLLLAKNGNQWMIEQILWSGLPSVGSS